MAHGTGCTVQAEVARLAVGVLGSVLHHALELPNGWRLLPLVHALLDEPGPPALTSHILMLLCCRTLGSIEYSLLSNSLPPHTAPSTASSARVRGPSALAQPYSRQTGVGPTPAQGAGTSRHSATSASSSCLDSSTAASGSGSGIASGTSSVSSALAEWFDERDGGARDGEPSPFWANLRHFLLCLDLLLLRSHAVWLAGGTIGLGAEGLGVGALGPSGLTMGDELLTPGAASHLVNALIHLTQHLDAPLQPSTAPVTAASAGGRLLTAHCSLLTARCSLLTVHYSQLTTHTYQLLTTNCSQLTAHCSLLTARCSLLVAPY